jgi:hypothetical protein
MPDIKVVRTGMAETILGSTTVRVLEDGSLTDNRIGVTLSTVPPHAFAATSAPHARRDIFRYSGHHPIRGER